MHQLHPISKLRHVVNKTRRQKSCQAKDGCTLLLRFQKNPRCLRPFLRTVLRTRTSQPLQSSNTHHSKKVGWKHVSLNYENNRQDLPVSEFPLKMEPSLLIRASQAPCVSMSATATSLATRISECFKPSHVASARFVSFAHLSINVSC